MIKHIHKVYLILAGTREWLANRYTLKVLTKIHLSESIQVIGHTHRYTDRQTHILIYRDVPYYVWGSENNLKFPNSSSITLSNQ